MKGWDLYILKNDRWHYLKTYKKFKCLRKYYTTHKGVYLIEPYDRLFYYWTTI